MLQSTEVSRELACRVGGRIIDSIQAGDNKSKYGLNSDDQ
jgi:hypothetical protein